MRTLVAFSEIMQHDEPTAFPRVVAVPNCGGVAAAEAIHCGTPMVLFTPRATSVTYTFSSTASVDHGQLPPVWRCSCGFQLDAQIPADGSSAPGTPGISKSRFRAVALSA